ncbi:MAG: transposase [Planctomycetota bacterium]
MLVGQGKAIPEVCREIDASENTYYRWRQKYGGMSPEMIKLPTRPGRSLQDALYTAASEAPGTSYTNIVLARSAPMLPSLQKDVTVKSAEYLA